MGDRNKFVQSIIDPFRIRHKREIVRQGSGKYLTWERQILPDAGAGQYSWETYGLPPFGFYGRGNIHVERPLNATSPASYVFQSVGIVGIPPTSIFQGQMITQPLMDPNSAEQMGIVLPGAVPNAPNAIGNGGPVLAP